MAHKKLNKFDSLIMIGKLACRRLVLIYRSNQDNKRMSKKSFTKKNSIGEIKEEEVTLHSTNAQCKAESLFYT